MSDRYFFKIKKPSSIITPYFRNNLSTITSSFQQYFNWASFEVPQEIWKKETVLSELDKAFEIERAGVISIEKDSIYDWHKDDYRGVSVNMVLECDHGHTLFKTRPSKYQVEKIKELKYEPNTFYLFNTQIDHCVINFNKTRYVFSCEFKKKKDELNYMTVLDWIKNNEK